MREAFPPEPGGPRRRPSIQGKNRAEPVKAEDFGFDISIEAWIDHPSARMVALQT
jgi:hypothetical protein